MVTAATISTRDTILNGAGDVNTLVWPDLFDLRARIVPFADPESAIVDYRVQLVTVPAGATERVAVWNSEPTFGPTWDGEMPITRESPLECAAEYWWRVLVTNRAGMVATHTSKGFFGDITIPESSAAVVTFVEVREAVCRLPHPACDVDDVRAVRAGVQSASGVVTPCVYNTSLYGVRLRGFHDLCTFVE